MNLSYLGLVLTDSTMFVLTLVLLLPITVLFVECIAALLPPKKPGEKCTVQPKITVLMAAHNEEPVIGATIATILPQLKPQDRLIVIADNCSDRTAQIAHDSGATVLKRNNLQHKGKGYALDYGLQHIDSSSCEVVIVLDADCHIQENYIESVAKLAMVSQRPVQPINLLHTTDKSNLNSAISELAFTVKNLVRPRGLARLNLPCMVTMGTAFPLGVIKQISLASNNLVEDMQLGIDLTIAGNPPVFCPQAKVMGVLPRRDLAATTQRTRWEHGHLSTLSTQVPRLLKQSWRQKRLDLLCIALDLSIPPLSFLFMIWFAVTAVESAWSILRGEWQFGIVLAMVEGLLLLISIFAAWAKFASKVIPLKSILSIPGYICWKVPIYFAFLLKPQQQWVRTERDVLISQISEANSEA